MLTLPESLVPSQFLRRVASSPNNKTALEESSHHHHHHNHKQHSKNNNSSASSAHGHLGVVSGYDPSSPAAKSNTTLSSNMSAATATTLALSQHNSHTVSSKLSGLRLSIPKGSGAMGAMEGQSTLSLRRGSVGTFRRTYSSNSIKKKSVEVTPSSFVKIRLLGKGDVGKVYLVRQKDTERLYAMKGTSN